jgi:hypothetical protein
MEARLGNSHAPGSDPAGDEHGTKAGFRDRTRAATASTRAPGIPSNRLCASKSAAACKTILSTCVPRKTGHPFATARWPANTGRHGLREEGMAWVRLLTRGSSGLKPRQGDVGAVAAWRGAGRGGACQGPGVGVELLSSFLVVTCGGNGRSSSGGAPCPSAGHGAEQEAAPAAPAFPTLPWSWAHVLQCPGSPSSRCSPSPRSPLLLLCCCGGRYWGRNPLAAAGRARARGGRVFIQAD